MRELIVNADDFGLSEGVNRGIAEAHEHGIVTSASLMVRGASAPAAAAYADAHRGSAWVCTSTSVSGAGTAAPGAPRTSWSRTTTTPRSTPRSRASSSASTG